MTTCFYNQKKSCTDKLTREHLVSASVLKVAFGESIRNISRAEIFGDKALVDHEAVVKDVCGTCNNDRLSPYDSAGKNLAISLEGRRDNTPLSIKFDKYTLGWIVKTHLNYVRVIKDREWSESYKIKQSIKNDIIKHKPISSNKLCFLVQQWEEEAPFWDAESEEKLPYMQYRSIRFRQQNIFLSNFRIRQLDTIVILPTNKCYKNFPARVASVIEEIKKEWGYSFQAVDIDKALSSKNIKISNMFTRDEIYAIRKKVNK